MKRKKMREEEREGEKERTLQIELTTSTPQRRVSLFRVSFWVLGDYYFIIII